MFKDIILKLNKENSKAFRVVKGVFALGVALEVGCFLASWSIYHKLNIDRGFRQYCSEKYPWALEGYYKLGETFDSANRIRYEDNKAWTKE